MKALVIDPAKQTVESADVSAIEDVKKIIGFDTVISDEIGPEGDRLYFDEECFLRGTAGRFQIDSVVPVSGKGVIVGADDDESLKDAVSDVATIQARLKYL